MTSFLDNVRRATRLASLGLIVWADVAIAAISLPQINTNNIVNITSYGASVTNADNATAIQNAINAATSGGTTNGLSGGTVRIPAGTNAYLSGPLTFKNYVNLQIDAGAVLRMLALTNYPGTDVSPPNFLSASSLHDLAITGSGAIDGQGLPWWKDDETNAAAIRPVMANFGACTRVLIQDVTCSNSPAAFLVVKGNAGNVTVQRVKIYAPDSAAPVDPSHNTDGLDLAETNALITGCIISTGDDNIAIGSSASVSRDIVVTNCTFGDGHGCSIGSYTAGGVSNVTVIDCSFTGTQSGFKVKSMRGRGGQVQNLNYLNLRMTNVDWPVSFDSHYEFGLGAHTTLTPAFVANNAFTNPAPLTSTTPIIQNITVSNVTATLSTTRPPFQIWALPEAPASNIVFRAVSISSSATYIPAVYNATNIQFIDCSFNLPAGANTMQFWSAGLIFTNSSPATNLFLLDGLTTNGIGNSLTFYNALGSLKNTNAFDDGPLTLSASTLTVSNDLSLFPTTVLNYVLSTNTTKLAVVGNLMLGGTNNLSAGPGFTNGTYTLITYTSNLNGSLPTLGATPSGAYTYALDTNTAHQVNLTVSSTCVHPTATVSGGGTICGGSSENIQAALTGTGPWNVTWSDGVVQSGVANSPAMRSVSPAVATNYTVTALSDSTGCTAGTLSGSATVTVKAHPTATVSGGGSICGGSSANIQAALTGTGPWSVTWSDGVVQSGVASGPAMRSVGPAVTTNYTVTALSDATGCTAGTLSGNATVTVNPHPTATVSGGGTICGGGSANIQAALTGTGPWNVTWSDGVVQNGVVSSPAMRSVSPAVTTNYTVTALSDATGCTAGTLSGSATLTVKAHPTATVTGAGTICGGSSANIQAALTGTGPWSVTWSDGVVQSAVVSSPATRSVSPTVTTNYTVTALSDSTGCSAGTVSGSATVTVNVHPTATVSGGGTICGGSSANIQAALTGAGPWTVTWSDGVVQSGVASSPATRSVSPAVTTNYAVTALSDSTGCSAGTLSGSALVTVCTAAPFAITSLQFLAPDQLEISWNSVSNIVYQIQSKDSPDAGSWTTNDTVVATGTTTSWTNAGVSNISQCFYRVVIGP